MTFIGGEYFLYPKWKDLLAEAAKRKITTNIISNGWMVNEDVVDFMKTANFDGLGISIDGGTAQTHDYRSEEENVFGSISIELESGKSIKIYEHDDEEFIEAG